MKLQICLTGVNLNRLYKECEKQGIVLFDVDRKDYKNISFKIDLKDQKKIKNIAKAQNYKYEESAKSGIAKIALQAKNHIGILIGTLLFATILIVLNFFVWDIKIYGVQNIEKSQIIQILSDCNVKVGCTKNSIDINQLEKALTNNIDDISLCSIVKKGTTLVVNIKEKISSQSLANFQTQGDIVALQNMTIREIDVAQGTAQKKVGDSVKAGEVIVAGYFFDINGNKIICKANAKIKATIWHTNATMYQKQKEVLVRTGNQYTISYMEFLGMSFPVETKTQNYEFFEAESTKTYAFKNNFLPVIYQKTTFFEVTKSIQKQNFENDRTKVVEQNERLAFAKVKSEEIVSKIFSNVEEFEDYFLITSFVQVDIEL